MFSFYKKFKLNCNVAISMDRQAIVGGVVNDANGSIIVSFAFKIGICIITLIEIRAIVLGIQVV